MLKAHETERDMHNLHTFKRRLGSSTPGVKRQGKGKIKKIRCKCATVAPYLAASSLRRSCASTSSPSPSKMERGPGGEARDNCNKCDNCDNPAGTAMWVLPTSEGWYRHHTPTAGKSAAMYRRASPCAWHVLEQSPAQSKGPRPYGILGPRLRLMHIGRPLWTGLARHFVAHSRGDGLSSPWQAFSVHFLLSRQAWMPFQLGRNYL
jgi:hypothetical protein